MGVEQYQGPIYIFAVQSKKYRSEYDRIFSKEQKEEEIMSVEITIGAPTEVKPIKHRVASPGKKLGRPKGSKNKKTIEKEKLVATQTVEELPKGSGIVFIDVPEPYPSLGAAFPEAIVDDNSASDLDIVVDEETGDVAPADKDEVVS